MQNTKRTDFVLACYCGIHMHMPLCMYTINVVLYIHAQGKRLRNATLNCFLFSRMQEQVCIWQVPLEHQHQLASKFLAMRVTIEFLLIHKIYFWHWELLFIYNNAFCIIYVFKQMDRIDASRNRFSCFY